MSQRLTLKGLGYQGVTIATAGTEVVIENATSIPNGFLWIEIGTAASAANLTYDQAASTIVNTTGVVVVTCTFYSNVDGAVFHIIPFFGPSTLTS